MRIDPVALSFSALLLAACGSCAAGDVYKCTNAAGALTYQDHPCAAGDAEKKMDLIPDAPPPPAAANPADDAAPAPAEPPVSASNPMMRAQANASVPTLFVCVHSEDGTQYMSRDGNPQPRLVPAGVLGVGGKSLAQTYAPGGVGVSAPGLRQTPVDRSAASAISGDYVAVQDRCMQATAADTCTYLQKQYDDVHQKLKRAFKDEQAILKPQEEQLSHDLDGC
jgi:Domain of unknown function (DUF4124)